ncbi:MAG: polysaccharide deacetylase family protein [Synergistaceae bacterium]
MCNDNKDKTNHISNTSAPKHHYLFILAIILILAIFSNIFFATKYYNTKKEISELQKHSEEKQKVLTSSVELKYQSLYKEMYSKYPDHFDKRHGKTLYLTFDDGPSVFTDSILKTLKEKNIKATFFVTGVTLKNPENKERLRLIAKAGHTIGLHTNCHIYRQIYSSVEDYLADFYFIWVKVKDITGIEPKIFRFPGGSINNYNANIYQQLIAEMTRRGFVYYDWNASGNDTVIKTATSSDIYNYCTTTKNRNNIILLLHDSNKKAEIVLPKVIDFYIKNGYEILPLTENVKPITWNYR